MTTTSIAVRDMSFLHKHTRSLILRHLVRGVARSECLRKRTLSGEATNHLERSRGMAPPEKFWISRARKRDFSPSDKSF